MLQVFLIDADYLKELKKPRALALGRHKLEEGLVDLGSHGFSAWIPWHHDNARNLGSVRMSNNADVVRRISFVEVLAVLVCLLELVNSTRLKRIVDFFIAESFDQHCWDFAFFAFVLI